MTQKNRARIRERERSVRRYLLTSSYGGAASLRIAEEGTPMSLDAMAEQRASESPRRGHRRASTGRTTERGRTIATATSSRKHDTFLCAGIEEYEQSPNWVLGPLGSSGCGLQCPDPIRKIVPNKGNKAHERRLRESPDFRRLYNRKCEFHILDNFDPHETHLISYAMSAYLIFMKL